jgi:hypothetical protein
MKPFESVQTIADLLPGQCSAAPVWPVYVRRPMSRNETRVPNAVLQVLSVQRRSDYPGLVAHLDNGACVPITGDDAWSVVL